MLITGCYCGCCCGCFVDVVFNVYMCRDQIDTTEQKELNNLEEDGFYRIHQNEGRMNAKKHVEHIFLYRREVPLDRYVDY